MSIAITFGGWLRERREMQGIGHDELAESLGCSRVTLLKIESGELVFPQMALILDRFIGVDKDEHATLAMDAHAEDS